MKKSMKMTALMLSALMLSSVMTTAASASDIFVGNGLLIAPAPSIEAEDTAEEDDVITGADKNIFKKVNVTGVYAEEEKNEADEPAKDEVKPEKPVKPGKPEKPEKPFEECVKHSYCRFHKKYDYCKYHGKLYGYKYYNKFNSREYLAEYFEDNTYNLNMYMGETKLLNSDMYYLSENPDVAYFDAESGKIVAASVGTTDIYVLTKGAVPVIRLVVTVKYKFLVKEPAKLIIDDEKWNLRVGEQMNLSVTSSNGEVYDDIVFKVTRGHGRVSLNKETGKVEAIRNGVVIICAYRASDPEISGDIILYVGANVNGILSGCFKNYEDRIEVDEWFDGEFDANSYYDVVGWVRGSDGTLIPVIAKNYFGMIAGDKETYIKYFERLWGSNFSSDDFIFRYNFIKYSKYFDKYMPCRYDSRYFFFVSNLIGIFGK
ncbi:MAG: hypothetical protein E7672_09200 [Ruminococcaceae bacterium]|nr:hypothetical protein [Oscillospiraceae bacterium]